MKWTSILSIGTLLLSIYGLLEDDPNPNQAVNGAAARLYLSDKEGYNRKARAWTRRYAVLHDPSLHNKKNAKVQDEISGVVSCTNRKHEECTNEDQARISKNSSTTMAEIHEVHPDFASSSQRLEKEFGALHLGEIPCVYVSTTRPHDLRQWSVTLLGPPDTPYQDGVFFVRVDFYPNYPLDPPRICFEAPIYHCNIVAHVSIEPDMLVRWNPSFSMGSVLSCIYSLLAEPNYCICFCNQKIAMLHQQDRTKHDEIAREWTLRHAMVSTAVSLSTTTTTNATACNPTEHHDGRKPLAKETLESSNDKVAATDCGEQYIVTQGVASLDATHSWDFVEEVKNITLNEGETETQDGLNEERHSDQQSCGSISDDSQWSIV